MGVSASSTAKQLLQLTTTVALCCISNSPISSCPSSLLSYSVVFLWKCNGICGILKYGFQKSQTLAVRSDAEFPLQIPAWQKRIPCQTPPWARCDQHFGKKDGPGIRVFYWPGIWCDHHLKKQEWTRNMVWPASLTKGWTRNMVWPPDQETRMPLKRCDWLNANYDSNIRCDQEEKMSLK